MSAHSLLSVTVLAPLGWIGRTVLAAVAYTGGVTLLGASALRAFFRPARDAPSLIPPILRQSASILTMAVPMVALLHVGLGSFLSMQAYFGGTFVVGTGAVVGVGLIRNIAPLMTGLTVAVLMAARTTPELRGGPRSPGDEGNLGAEKLSPLRRFTAPRPVSDPGWLAAVRIGGAMLIGPALVLWGVAVGTVVGWQIAKKCLGVSTDAFFDMFFEMLWVRDVLGMLIKGMAFSLFAAIFACHEGLRKRAGDQVENVPAAACRAACLSAAAILTLNSAWFVLIYQAGPAFGPTLMNPPTP